MDTTVLDGKNPSTSTANPFSSSPRDDKESVTSGARETTPLVGDATISTSPSKGGFAIPSATELKETATQSLKTVAEKAIKAKNSMKKSPWIVSLVIGVSSFGVIAAGVFGLVTYLVRLHVVMVVIKVYQILFGVICLTVEASRYYNIFNIKGILRRWAPILELNIGRGLLHILTAGLALASDWTIGEALPGAILATCGIFNIIWGIKTAMQVKRLFEKLKTELKEAGEESSAGILLIQQKFSALDLNGDGKLSKEELEIGCKSLNLDLGAGELDMVFSLLDPKCKGYIGIDDFEQWWYSEKDPLSYVV